MDTPTATRAPSPSPVPPTDDTMPERLSGPARAEDPAGAPTRTPRSHDELPGPRGLPIVGHLLQIDRERFHQQLEGWAATYGPVFGLRFGPRRALVVTDHEAIVQVLRDRPDGFRRTVKLEQTWQGMGLPIGVFGANGDVWRRQRRMVMAAFDPGHVRRYHPSLQRVAGRLDERWRSAAADDRVIDLQADLMRFTVDVIAGLAFGAEVDTLRSEGDRIQRHLNRIFPTLFRRALAPLPVWRWWPTADDRALAHSVAAIQTEIDGFIAQARERLAADPARRAAPHNLLEAMLVAAEAPDSGIDDAQVAGNVLTMLLAGEDTTANTLCWAIWFLWRHPAARDRAVDEVRRVCGDPAAPTADEVARLDFVEAVAHETMRLKPVAPIQVLQALRPTVVAGVQVEPGMVLVELMRRDATHERYVPHADAFEPERWLDTDAASALGAARRASMPFGAGPRICPGRYLALTEIKVALAVLLGGFELLEVGTADGREPAERLQFAMAPVGLRMRLRRRADG
jgi:cytochrome P450